MKCSWRNLLISGALGVGILVFDRLTKAWALTLVHELIINHYFSFQLVFNRGLSFGILNSQSSLQALAVTFGVLCIIGLLLWHTVTRFKEEKAICAEIFVLIAACSNLFDRFYYGGVIDFIVLTYNGYVWPIFNVADVVIVCGITSMFLQHLLEYESQ